MPAEVRDWGIFITCLTAQSGLKRSGVDVEYFHLNAAFNNFIVFENIIIWKY